MHINDAAVSLEENNSQEQSRQQGAALLNKVL